MNLPTCFITPGAQKHSWYLLVPLTSPCAATDPYLQTKNICVGMLSTLFDPFLWTPQSGIVLGAAEKTILLALLGVFLFLACNRKYFTWDLFSSATIELWSCSFVVVDLLYQLKELSKHTSFVNLTNGKKEKRTNPTSQDAKKMTFIFSLVHFHVNTSVNRRPCGSALGIIELLGKLAALYGIPVKDLTRLIVFQVVFSTSGKWGLCAGCTVQTK